MLTVKLYLRQSKTTAERNFNLMLRIRKGRESSREVKLCSLSKDEWDEADQKVLPSHPQHKTLNTLIRKRYLEASTTALDASVRGETLDPLVIVNGVKPKPTSFLEHCQFYLDRLNAQHKTHTATKSAVHLRVLQEYLGTARNGEQKDLFFQAATEQFWVSYAQWERAVRATGVNTLARRMSFFRSVWNDALRRKLTTLTPLEFLRFPEQETFKPALTEMEIEELAALPLQFGTCQCTSRDVFLFQYWAQGLRVSDALCCRLDDIDDDYIRVRDQKTGKPHLIALHPRLKSLVYAYAKASTTAYLFPMVTWERNAELSYEADTQRRYRMIESKTRTINHELGKIAAKLGWEKRLSTHIARHSFARHADEVIDDKRVIQTMLQHANLTRTMGYLEKIRTSAVDKAVEKIYRYNPLKSDSENPT